jgi:hypothetical protein
MNQVHVELTEEGDQDFPPSTFVAYCDGCDAGIAWRTLRPVSGWMCDEGDRVVPVTDVSACRCPNCGLVAGLPTLFQLLREPRWADHIRSLEHEPTLATALATSRRPN